MQAIRLLHAESNGTYGSPRLHAELNDSGFACGRAKVARLMHLAGLKGCPKRRFRVTTKRGLARASNLLDQNFSAETTNERWASDITYIWTGQGWLYPAVVMDLYSRRYHLGSWDLAFSGKWPLAFIIIFQQVTRYTYIGVAIRRHLLAS